MRAVLCRELAGIEGLRVEQIDQPRPGPGEVLIRVKAAALNFADTLMIRGRYQEKPALPFTPGMELAGEVASLGEGVSGLEEGARVMAVVDHGAFAERTLARAADVFAIPDPMPFTEAAGFPIAYGTALGALSWRAGLRPGETLVVHGAAGGVGLPAVECGKAMGARVIATARGVGRLAIARGHGADEVIDTRSQDVRGRLLALTEGKGADVVLDPVGGDLLRASLRALAWEGRLVLVGFASGDVPELAANRLLVKNIAAIGFYWGSYRRHDPVRVRRSFEALLDWHQEGRLRPHISHRLPLERFADAFHLLTARKSTGKVVLEP